MYPYEDRIRPVEIYIKLGKRIGATIRQLGYPTKNALKGWYREFEQRLDLSAGYARSKPKYSQAQKAAAVEHCVSRDRCIASTMRALGYPGRGTLSAWVREAHPESRKAMVGITAIGRIERGVVEPRLGSMDALASFFGIELSEMYRQAEELRRNNIGEKPVRRRKPNPKPNA